MNQTIKPAKMTNAMIAATDTTLSFMNFFPFMLEVRYFSYKHF